MTAMSDPILDEAFRVFPAWQDFAARLMAGDCDPLTVNPRDVFDALTAVAELDDRAIERLCYLMLANGYADTIFEAGGLLGRLYGMCAVGLRPRCAVELGIAP